MGSELVLLLLLMGWSLHLVQWSPGILDRDDEDDKNGPNCRKYRTRCADSKVVRAVDGSNN